MPLPNVPKMSGVFMDKATDSSLQFDAARTDIKNTTLYFQRLRTELDQQQADQNAKVDGIVPSIQGTEHRIVYTVTPPASDAPGVGAVGDFAQSDVVQTNNLGMGATIDIAPTYSGQTSISQVGTIDTGRWQGDAIAQPHGGTGQDTSTTSGVPVLIAGLWTFVHNDQFLISIFALDTKAEDVSTAHHGLAPQAPGDTTTFLNGAGPPTYVKVKDSDLAITDITANNVTNTAHGFAPKSPGDATTFLNGNTPPAYLKVKDSDLALTDITANNVVSTLHGFAPKSPADATKFLNGAATPAYAQVKDSDIVFTTGTFTATGTGFTVNPTVTATWLRIGPVIFLYIPLLTGTSNSTDFTITGLPAQATPGHDTSFVYPCTDNGLGATCWVFLANGVSTIGLGLVPTSTWTNHGTKAFTNATLVY